MVGSLARTLMKKAIRFAGDGAKSVTVSLLASSEYDPETGEFVTINNDFTIGPALMGQVTESESVKYRLTTTTHKATVAMLDYEANGSPTLPESSDRILIDSKPWLIDKVRFGSMNQSITFYICEA